VAGERLPDIIWNKNNKNKKLACRSRDSSKSQTSESWTMDGKVLVAFRHEKTAIVILNLMYIRVHAVYVLVCR
jgi:hypothetical protein